MKYVKLYCAAFLVGVLVGLLYLGFEYGVSHAIKFVWEDLFHSETNRLVIIPLTIGLGVIYFALKHFIETKFGDKQQSVFVTLLSVLIVGFFSLFAGASLGPEAILVPASLLTGAIIANALFMKKQASILGIAGFVALFVGFFGSLLGGLLGLYLALKSTPQKLKLYEYGAVIVAALAALVILYLLSSKGSFHFPSDSHFFTIETLLLSAALFIAGVVAHKGLELGIRLFGWIKTKAPSHWLVRSLIASVGLAILFIIGGPLVQFTGNESITPVLQQAQAIGLLGLIGIVIVKLAAIAWSHSLGYKGGLIFPLIFVGSSISAIALLYFNNFSVILVIFAFLAGAIFADRTTHFIIGGKE